MARPLKARHESARTVSAFVVRCRQRLQRRRPRRCRHARPSSFERGMTRFPTSCCASGAADRRWRIFFRLAWLMLFVVIAWALLAGARPRRRAERSAHRAGRGARRDRRRQRSQRRKRWWPRLKGAFEDAGAQAVVLRINSPGRQPGAGRHRQRRDQAPEGQAQEAGLRGGRGGLRLGRLLHRRGGRRDLRRQGQPRRLDRRADGRLRLRRHDGKARRRAPAADRRREQGHARPVLAAEREAQGLCAGDDRPDPPAVHQGRQGRPRQAPEGGRPTPSPACSGTARRRCSQGLADQLGNLDFVAREVVKAEEVIDYTPKENVAERLAKRFGASIGEGAVRALRSLAPIR